MSSPAILSGTELAVALNAETAARAAALPVTPTLATVLVGDDPGSAKYVAMKQRRCAEFGLGSRHVHMPAATTTTELVAVLTGLGADPGVHGILLQHPLPSQIDERAAFDAVPLAKDVDGTSSAAFAAAALGQPGHRSCTPAGIVRLLDHYRVELDGADVVIVGRSAILGKPLAAMLTARDATVTVCHSRTRDLAAHTRRADILVAAAGRPRLITTDMIRPGAVVVDACFTPGDVAPDAAEVASAVTPRTGRRRADDDRDAAEPDGGCGGGGNGLPVRGWAPPAAGVSRWSVTVTPTRCASRAATRPHRPGAGHAGTAEPVIRAPATLSRRTSRAVSRPAMKAADSARSS